MADTVITPTTGVLTLDVVRSTLPFDLSCAHTAPCDVSGARCQLWVGHDGDHAVMFNRNGARVVRTWRADDARSIRDGADCRSQPWARGFPLPAWHEDSPQVERARRS